LELTLLLAGLCGLVLGTVGTAIPAKYLMGVLKSQVSFYKEKAEASHSELMFLVKHIRDGKANVTPEDEEWGSYAITNELEVEREEERTRKLEPLPPLVIPS
jgi:hypothetical protein